MIAHVGVLPVEELLVALCGGAGLLWTWVRTSEWPGHV